MTQRNTAFRTLHEIGLAAWFGGSLAGAVAVNGAAARASDPRERLRIANAGWARWNPVNLAAIGAHLAGQVGVGLGNKSRIVAQKGVASSSAAMSGLTVAALAVSAYGGMLGKKLKDAEGRPVEGATEPAPETAEKAAAAQRRLRVCQWLVPALTGAMIVVDALHGEQQRPSQQLPGLLARPARALGLPG
ncbi:hypothetical protein ACL02T_01410 [Pseudonocardia sp. RS010]|uniref:hypothetical protein n=1 Tax=Pseudonocardia sp. RS010 TaxID=3385979 RepID=UPI0039A38E83